MTRIAAAALIALVLSALTSERTLADPPVTQSEGSEEKSYEGETCCHGESGDTGKSCGDCKSGCKKKCCGEDKPCCHGETCCAAKACCKAGENVEQCCEGQCECHCKSKCAEAGAVHAAALAVPSLFWPVQLPEIEKARQQWITRASIIDLDLPIIQTGYASSAAAVCEKNCNSCEKKPTAAAQPHPAPRPNGGPVHEIASEEETTQVLYNIEIIEDRHGCLSEFEALQQGLMFADSSTLLPAMRILHKHQLIRTMSSPKLICTTGHTAQLAIGGETTPGQSDSWEGIRIEVASNQYEKGLKVELALDACEEQQKYAVQTSVLVEPGQSIVLNANALPTRKSEAAEAQHAVYIVLTPELVDGSSSRR